MDVDHVLTVTIAWLMLIGAVMPNLAALFMRYDTRRRWLLAVGYRGPIYRCSGAARKLG